MAPKVKSNLASVAVGVLAGCCVVGAAFAATRTSHATNWQTPSHEVVCGIALVHGTHVDPGTGAQENGLWPGLQCSAPGIHKPPGIGDPFVQLGQGRAGRAKVVDLSQDDLIYNHAFTVLAAGTAWTRDGITCAVHRASIACHNSPGHGFTLSPGHVSTH